ncbi:LysR family transcriptional regulator, partial [Pseudomonas syringae]
MSTHKLNDLQAFLREARDRSCTKAATRRGVTPSALSHTMSGCAERVGLRLQARP